MDWYAITDRADAMTYSYDGRLTALSEEWQRELAALSRLERDVNNGAYLQFLVNCERESYVYASQALKKIGAQKMAAIIDNCQTIVDEHFDSAGASPESLRNLLPNKMIGGPGFDEVIKEDGSILPDSAIARIYELSYEFMDYPEDLPQLGLQYYGPILRRDGKYLLDGRGLYLHASIRDRFGDYGAFAIQCVFMLCGFGCLTLIRPFMETGGGGLALLAAAGGIWCLYFMRRI